MSGVQIDKGFFYDLAKRVRATLPPEDRFTEEDARVIAEHKDFLLSLTEELVQAFYDSLFAHDPTRAVFREGERPKREETLRAWWRRTVEGPFDEAYWAWQAYVGLVHVRRKVTNTMMIGHAGLVASLVAGKAHAQGLPRLAEAVQRLMTNVAALVVEGYEEIHWEAVMDLTGQNRTLIQRIVEVSIHDIDDFRFRK